MEKISLAAPKLKITPGGSGESTREWWDKAHLTNDHAFLTGSSGEEVWQNLQIRDRIVPGCKVLNIGVGLGLCTRALAAQGAKVSVLDISQVALDRVVDVTEKQYLESSLETLPRGAFDLAVSYLVTQHMQDAALDRQMAHVIPCLKPGGLFAMQFAYHWEQKSGTINANDPEAAKEGSLCRTLFRVAEIAHNAGGLVVWSEIVDYFPSYNAGWYGMHIVGREDPVWKRQLDKQLSPGFRRHSYTLTQEVEALRQEVRELMNSRSMRMTQPLRSAAHLLRRLRGKP